MSVDSTVVVLKALTCKCFSVNSKLVLCYLVWGGTQVRTVNCTQIGNSLHMNRDTVSKAVKYLKDKGFLTDLEPYKNNAGKRGKYYRINL